MPFQKAQPQQARLKVSIYGPPGSGKTFTALLMAEGLAAQRGKRIAYVDTEHGTDFYAMNVPERPVHPSKFDIDTIYTKSISKILDEVMAIDQSVHGVVVIDSISHVWESAMEAYEGRKTSSDGIPMHAWGAIKKPYKTLINFLIGSQLDVFILGRQKNIFGKDDRGELVKTGVTMKAEGETAYEPHICLRMESEIHATDRMKSRPVIYVEKDRTGILQGQTIYWPNFSTVEPILPLLGDVQASVEDEDERIAADAEGMERMSSDKAKSKEDKSAKLYADFAAKISNATDQVGLGAIVGDMKKSKRYIMEAHWHALGELFTSARDRIFPRT